VGHVPAATSFPELLDQCLRRDPGRPLLTFYDDATGERTELSGTTYANWVAKTANLFLDELLLDPGDTVLVDLPPHWLGAVLLGGAWSAGLAVSTDAGADRRAVVCGPRFDDYAGTDDTVVACALLPFARPFGRPLPGGVLDHGLLWPGQSDAFVAAEPAGADSLAWQPEGLTQRQLLAEARDRPGGRLLTDASPLSDRGVAAFLAPLVHGGSLVLVANADAAAWPGRRDSERATRELRAQSGSV
jgi:uncharacterized protein (TIGR03089 family)